MSGQGQAGSCRRAVLTLLLVVSIACVSCSQAGTIAQFVGSHCRYLSDPSLLMLEERDQVDAQLIINDNEETEQFLRRLNDLAEHLARTHARVLVVTGGYSDQFGKIVGLAVQDGQIISRAAANWDGFLTIDAMRHVSVDDVSELHIAKGSAVDQLPESLLGKSGFQTHLIVRDAANQVSVRAPLAAARRRAVIVTADNRIGVIDSRDAELSLHDWSALLIDKYAAVRALNLDMGTYNICLLRSTLHDSDCGTIGVGVKLSNALILTSR